LSLTVSVNDGLVRTHSRVAFYRYGSFVPVVPQTRDDMRPSEQAGAPAAQIVWVLVVDHESDDVIPPVVCATDDLAKRQAGHVAESYDLTFGHWVQSGGGACLTAEGPDAVFRIYRCPVRES